MAKSNTTAIDVGDVTVDVKDAFAREVLSSKGFMALSGKPKATFAATKVISASTWGSVDEHLIESTFLHPYFQAILRPFFDFKGH